VGQAELPGFHDGHVRWMSLILWAVVDDFDPCAPPVEAYFPREPK